MAYKQFERILQQWRKNLPIDYENAEELRADLEQFILQLQNEPWETHIETINQFIDGQERCPRCQFIFPRRQLGYSRKYWNNSFMTILHCPECESREYDQKHPICVICGERWAWKLEGSRYFCPACRSPKYDREELRVETHLARARRYEEPATLSVKEWIETLNFFNWACSYCGRAFTDMEHYYSLGNGYGTTRENCLPSCRTCNQRKGHALPVQFRGRFDPQRIERIERYLSNQE